jgi:hypothetical protein
MTSNSETGHAKNVSNFDQLIVYVTSYGSKYNPSKPAIKLDALDVLKNSANKALDDVNLALPAYSNAVAARDEAFNPLSKLVTRVFNALKATGTTEQVDENAQTLVRKITGKRATAKKTDQEKEALKAQGKEVKEISTSQMSFDSRLGNFDKFIKLLGSIPLYIPNEVELSVAGLQVLYTDLSAKNSAVVLATTELSNARIARNKVLYNELTGLVDTAADVKTYLKSVYGTTAPEFKQVSQLAFKAIKP